MPRLYTIRTSSGEVHRNRYHLAPRLGESSQIDTDVDFETEASLESANERTSDIGERQTVPRSPIQTCLRTGTTVRPPSRFSSST